MKTPLRERLRAQTLPEDELSEAEQQLLREVIDRDLQAQWAKALAAQGVHREPASGKIRNLRPWLAVAATILLLAIAGWWMWNRSTPDADQMATVMIEETPDPEFNAISRGTNEPAGQLKDINDAYLKHDYQTTLAGIMSYINNGTANVNDYVVAGWCNLRLSKPDTAAAFFLEARRLDDTGNYADDLRWYLGLSYTLLNEKEKALEELRASRRKTPQVSALIEALMSR
ncbi:MAG: hypothetical protein HUU01_04770 [Saprospiraceae bacterium]|nr:hypothetical protein [Saprospiraceae bacterium]